MKIIQVVITTNLLKISFLLLVLLSLYFNSCKVDEDDMGGDEQELITTVRLIVSGAAISGGTQTFTWKDLDGPGGNAPVIETIRLPKESTIDLELQVWDESKTPAEDITAEIEAEADDHIFLFSSSGVSLTIEPEDTDSGGEPVGLINTLKTINAGSGSVRIILKHLADKSSPEATGETDIDVSFPVVVE